MRLRFTIRDLLWLTIVAALAVGWWLDRSRLSSKLDNSFYHVQTVGEDGFPLHRWLPAHEQP